MGRPFVFPVDTTLYHPSEGARVFPAGETDPGSAWTETRGGEPVDKGTIKQATKDLIAAQDQIDALGEQLNRKDHDLAVIGKERDEANGKVADLEQRAIAAEAGQVEADERAAEYMRERDAARADFQRVSDQVTEANANVERLVGELGEAQQSAADAEGRVQELETDLANAKAASPAKGKL